MTGVLCTIYGFARFSFKDGVRSERSKCTFHSLALLTLIVSPILIVLLTLYLSFFAVPYRLITDKSCFYGCCCVFSFMTPIKWLLVFIALLLIVPLHLIS